MDMINGNSRTKIHFDQISSVLAQARIPVHKWKQTNNGALEDFMEMIQKEAVDLHHEDGHLILHVIVAVPYIGYHGNGKMQELYEAYQLHMDELRPWNVTFKSRPFKGSLGETMLRYPHGKIEDGRKAIERGIREELDWHDSSLYELSEWLGNRWETIGPIPSGKYAGLNAVYHRYRMHCVIKDELYRPQGYTHIDSLKKKKEVFFWRDI